MVYWVKLNLPFLFFVTSLLSICLCPLLTNFGTHVVLSRVKKTELDTGMKKVVYKACADCTGRELVTLLGNMVNGSPDGALGNGLPGDEDARLSRKEIQSMATDWKKELESLFPKTSK